MDDLLARFEPVPPAIDRDWLMFQAGQAYALARLQGGHAAPPRNSQTKTASDAMFLSEHQIALGGKSAGPRGGWSAWLWPAASSLWASVATISLAVLLVRRDVAPPSPAAIAPQPSGAVAQTLPDAKEAPTSARVKTSPKALGRLEEGSLPAVAEARPSERRGAGPALSPLERDLVAELSAAWPLYARMLPGSREADTLAAARLEAPASSASAAALRERRSDPPSKPPLTPTSLWRTRQMQELGFPVRTPAGGASGAAWWLPILWNRGQQGI